MHVHIYIYRTVYDSGFIVHNMQEDDAVNKDVHLDYTTECYHVHLPLSLFCIKLINTPLVSYWDKHQESYIYRLPKFLLIALIYLM